MAKVLHMCLNAPTDFLAWRQLDVGSVCQYCKEVITGTDGPLPLQPGVKS